MKNSGTVSSGTQGQGFKTLQDAMSSFNTLSFYRALGETGLR